MNARDLNGLALAYIGDAYYELLIREFLIGQGITKVKELHTKATLLARSDNQVKFINYFLTNNILESIEVDVFKKGRNAKPGNNRKKLPKEIQHKATGFEALIGHLYLENKKERIMELFTLIIKFLDCEGEV
ncbi:MAG: ribonuclease III [Erysipelotrichales bacterium]|nr:ribonuclease III [Erysipelotrichales bacterium]